MNDATVPLKVKKLPPLPKFQSKTAPSQEAEILLEAKLTSFLSQIKQEANEAKTLPDKGTPALESTKQEKKKFELASINSKLNSMLSSKRIALKQSTPSGLPEETIQTKAPSSLDYDPNTPNNYQVCRNNYLSKMQQLQVEEPEILAPVSESVVQEVDSIAMLEESGMEQKQQLALRMMQKFGYKVGTGLGKQSQGITTPLIIKKTTDTACRIEPSSIPLNHFISADTSARNALAANGIAITSVVVFVGLLSLEELTDELEKELRIECELYGMVSKWMIFLFGEELRIFAAYQNREMAFKAFVKTNNKYFMDKLASVRFYDEALFANNIYDGPVHAHVIT